MNLVYTELLGELSSPEDNWKKLSQQVLLHFSVGMATYDHCAKYYLE